MRWEMKKPTSRLLLGVTLFISVFCFFASGVMAGADSENVCLDCHDDIIETLEMTAHELGTISGNSGETVTCISCHSNGEVHAEDPSVDNIGIPSSLSGDKARKACASCHQPHLELDNFGFDVHSELLLNCSSCHQVHGGEPELLLSNDANFCLKCHDAVTTSFARRSQHPLNQGNITCLDCHSFTKQRDNAVAYDLEKVCQDCHPEQSGPFPFEHEVAYGASIEGSGCMACHNPHGSENDFLLKQKGEQLCIQCHMKPPGHETLSPLHASVASIKNCYACHSDIHGSYVSQKFLDPSLDARLGSNQNCSDCHNLTD